MWHLVSVTYLMPLCLFLAPLCCPFIVSCHSLFLVLSSLTSFRSPSLASCQYFALLLTNFDHLCPCSSPDPFFCPSFTLIVLIFLPCSPRVPSLWSFSLASCHYFFLCFPSSSPFTLFYWIVPIFLPCASPLLILFTYFRSPLRFSFFAVSPRVLSCHVHLKNMHSGFVPFSFRPRSGRVSFSFHFRFGRIPDVPRFRFLFVQSRSFFVQNRSEFQCTQVHFRKWKRKCT